MKALLFLLNVHLLETLLLLFFALLIIAIGIIFIIREKRKEKKSYLNPLILNEKFNNEEFYVKKKETEKVLLTNWKGYSRWYLITNIPNEYLIPKKYFLFTIYGGVRQFKELPNYSGGL